MSWVRLHEYGSSNPPVVDTTANVDTNAPADSFLPGRSGAPRSVDFYDLFRDVGEAGKPFIERVRGSCAGCTRQRAQVRTLLRRNGIASSCAYCTSDGPDQRPV
jgi:hypothetical protein